MVNVNTVVLTLMDHMNVHATLDMRLGMMASPVKVSKNFKVIILYNNHSLPSPSPSPSLHPLPLLSCSSSPSLHALPPFTLSLSLLSCPPSPCLHTLPPPPVMLSLSSLSLPSSFHYCHPLKHLFFLFRCK